jgi:cytochrome c-type biogenesis protein CcsB|uniref:Cytochrome c biogenesis protein CcsA n=1 Tax=Thorea hispida TaxID=202687 RepID=A0A1C9CAH6_9FLOR|nr:cytochrome c biogenesis protein [Thorea hispida]AOM65369.1 cytochrome c biogenesis protein [Thorea hispida]
MDWDKLQYELINISFLLLFISLIIYWSQLTFPKISRLQKIGKIQIISANLLISISLICRWIINKYFPLSNLYESLLFLTWCLTFVQIIIENQINNIFIGAINIPIQLFIIGLANLSLTEDMQQAKPLVPALQSNWLMMHVTVMILSYAFLIIGSLLSILFLVISQKEIIEIKGSSTGYVLNNNSKIHKANYQNSNNNKYIKKDKNNSNSQIFTKLNLLEGIDNLSYRIIGLGFPLLTLGIISGAVWANQAWGSYWSWDPKETWALVTWLIFAVYLHSRLTKSWYGKKPALLASIGFLIIWVCYLGVNFLGKGLHSYGWIS